MYEVAIKKTFSAAHMLEEIGGKCENLHGHNFTVEVVVTSESLNDEGVVVDFRQLKAWTSETLDLLDHRLLNELPYFQGKNPSAENLAKFIYDRLAEKTDDHRVTVARVSVWESETSRASCIKAIGFLPPGPVAGATGRRG